MSYDGKDLSAQDSLPIYLVKFVQNGTEYRYNTTAQTVNRSGVDWYAEAVELGDFLASGEVAKDPLQVRLPYTNPLAATFVGYAPDFVTTLTVWRTHADDTDVRVVWKGRVGSTTFNEKVVTLACESVFTSIRRAGPGPCYTRACRWVLGGRGCNVDLLPFTHALTATSAVGAKVTVTGAGSYALAGGTLAWGGISRKIIAQSGTELTLMRWVRPLNVALAGGSQSVSCVEPCDRTPTTCRTKFYNLGRFGGQPGIPAINPMSTPIGSIGP